jgi:hypothetical protein
MRDERELGKELLKRNGIGPAEEFRETLREVAALLARERMARERARARRATWLAILSLAAVAVLHFGRGALGIHGLFYYPAPHRMQPLMLDRYGGSLVVDVGIVVGLVLCILALAVAIPIWVRSIFPEDRVAPGEVPERGRAELWRMIERDKKRGNRMKWATVVAWSLLALVYIVAVVGERVQGPHTMELPLIFPSFALFWVAVACTVSWYIRSSSVSQREIQASLADLAEQVRQLVEDQRADRAKGTSAPGPEPGSETDKG